MKKEIGHDITKLYKISQSIVSKHQINFQYRNNLDDEIYVRILGVLSGFAIGDRYSNIDILVGSVKSKDPINNWYNNVDKYLFENYVSKRKKQKIDDNAKNMKSLLDGKAIVLHVKEDGSEIHDAFGGAFQTGFIESVGLLRQFYTMQIVRYWCEILYFLQHRAHGVKMDDIPNFIEFFGEFMNDDDYIKRRSKWNIR